MRNLILILAWTLLIVCGPGITPEATAQTPGASSTNSIPIKNGNDQAADDGGKSVVVSTDFVDKCAQAADEVMQSRAAIAAFERERDLNFKVLNLTRELAELRREQAEAAGREAEALRSAVGAKEAENKLLKSALDAARKKRRGFPVLSVLKTILDIAF